MHHDSDRLLALQDLQHLRVRLPAVNDQGKIPLAAEPDVLDEDPPLDLSWRIVLRVVEARLSHRGRSGQAPRRSNLTQRLQTTTRRSPRPFGARDDGRWGRTRSREATGGEPWPPLASAASRRVGPCTRSVVQRSCTGGPGAASASVTPGRRADLERSGPRPTPPLT